MVGVHDRPRQLLLRTEREGGDRVRVTVRDAGTGFDRQSMDKLFDPFYTTKSDGMGIGLSVSRSIVERHHGRLWAEPNDGPGATFSFSIPRGPDSVGIHDGQAVTECARQYQSLIDGCRLSGASFNDVREHLSRGTHDGQAFTGVDRR
jgi:hypothetical protein